MSEMNFKQKVMLGVIEATYAAGLVAASATSTNALPLQNLSIKPLEGELKSRDLVSHDMGNDKQFLVGKHVKVEGEVPLYASGAAGTASKSGFWLRLAGMSEVVTAGTSVDYQFVNENFESGAFWYYQNNLAHKIKGARVNVALTFKSMDYPVMKVTITGLYEEIVDAAPPTGIDWSSITDPIEISKEKAPTFQLFGQDLVMDNLEMDFGNAISYRNKVNYEGVRLTDRSLTGKVTVDAVPLATRNFFQDAAGSTIGLLKLTIGTVAGKIIEITHSKVQVLPFEYAEVDGVTGFSMPLRFLKGGNFKIAFK